MSVPFSSPESKRLTIDVVVGLSPTQVPPTLPFELRDYVSPNTWEARVVSLTRLASHYWRPLFERAYIAMLLVLSFLVPITTYYITLQILDDPAPTPKSGTIATTSNEVTEQRVWFARLTALGVTLVMLIFLCVPVVLWKYLGKRRVRALAEQWTKGDMLAAPSYEDAPIWKANAPGFFRDAIVLTVTVPMTQKSNFDRDSFLPPYINPGDDGLPSYGDSKLTQWSTDPKGGTKYGDVPIFTNDYVEASARTGGESK